MRPGGDKRLLPDRTGRMLMEGTHTGRLPCLLLELISRYNSTMAGFLEVTGNSSGIKQTLPSKLVITLPSFPTICLPFRRTLIHISRSTSKTQMTELMLRPIISLLLTMATTHLSMLILGCVILTMVQQHGTLLSRTTLICSVMAVMSPSLPSPLENR